MTEDLSLGGDVTFRLGVSPSPPEEVIGHLFEEQGRQWLATSVARTLRTHDDELFCSFSLPQLPPERVCLVIEGRWP